MKFSNTEIADLLKASYDPILEDVEGSDRTFSIDKTISDTRMKVFIVPDHTEVLVIHRGSQDLQDWIDNTLHLIDVDLTLTKTYNVHLRKHMKAVNKYGKENIIVLGHSRGGLYSDQFYKEGLAKQNISYNKPIRLRDILNSLFSTPDENDITVRTSADIPSAGQNLIPNNPNDVLIPSDSYIDPAYNHTTDRLLDLPEDTQIGSGSKFTEIRKFVKKIDYTKIRKNELKEIVKKNKKQLNVNITGLTKKELIAIVERIIN